MSEHEFILIEKEHAVRHQQRNRFLYRVLIVGLGVVLLFIVVTIIIGSSSPPITSPKYGPKTDNIFLPDNCSIDYTFDYYLFVLRWPATICNDSPCAKHDNKWLIHGRWPQKNNNKWPQYCCFERQFIVKQLEPIFSELTSDWTNLEQNMSFDSLWAHEWSRHGTCTKTHQFDYFNDTIGLYRDVPIDQWLQESNIIPSNDLMYTITSFENVFNAKLKHTVQINCVKQNGKIVLTDVRICYTKSDSLQPIDCKLKSTCKDSFYYPKADN